MRKLLDNAEIETETAPSGRPLVTIGLGGGAVVAAIAAIVRFVIMAPTAAAAPVTHEDIRNALAQHHTEMHTAIEREISILTNVERLMWINCVRSAKGYQQTEECGALHR